MKMGGQRKWERRGVGGQWRREHGRGGRTVEVGGPWRQEDGGGGRTVEAGGWWRREDSGGRRTVEAGHGGGGSTEAERHSTHSMDHSHLLLLRPLLLLGSEQSLVLCKHGQLQYPATAGILHSSFHLQEMTGERHSKGQFSRGMPSYVFYIVSPYVQVH